jgi:glycosyltransferase involved in cell wall biosynthesis
MPEAIVHGETGLLVTPEDADALHEAIATLFDDDQMRKALGEAGRRRMQNEFSIATMADKHEALYASTLNDVGN